MRELLGVVDKRKAIYILILGLLSGGVNFLFLALINHLLFEQLNSDTTFRIENIVLFGSLLIVFLWITRALSYITIEFTQKVFWSIREKVVEKVLGSTYEQVNASKEHLYSTLTHDVAVLTNFSMSFIQFVSSTTVVIACFIYMGVQSPLFCLITVLTTVLASSIYLLNNRLNLRLLQRSRDMENDFVDNFTAILDGFKEIQINPKKGQDIYQKNIKKVVNKSLRNNIKAFSSLLNNQIVGHFFFYALIAYALIFHSTVSNVEQQSIGGYIFILLFLLGSVQTIMILVPTILSASVSANRLSELSKNLYDENVASVVVDQEREWNTKFSRISIDKVEYRYGDSNSESGFSIGPVSNEFKKGEITFIYGGNGSGKSTLIKVILGLLNKEKGEIYFNQQKLSPSNYDEYRSLFSVVYSDYYLFKEFVGIPNVDVELLEELVRMFEVSDKITFDENQFSTTDLSTGQRKRLAIIIALLEKRPILILDEWAADQDPMFRKKFYTEILPQLRRKGLCVIAITHDDGYYEYCDKLIKMEFGQAKDETGTIVSMLDKKENPEITF